MSADDSLLVQRLRAADTDSLREEARTVLPPLVYLFALSFAVSGTRIPLWQLDLTSPVGVAAYYQHTWLFHMTLAIGVAVAVRRGVVRHRIVLGVVAVVTAVELNVIVSSIRGVGSLPTIAELEMYVYAVVASFPLPVVFSLPPIVVGYGVARLLDR